MLLVQGITLLQDAGTSDDSGRASERLTGSSVAPRDPDSSRDRLSDVRIIHQARKATEGIDHFTIKSFAIGNQKHYENLFSDLSQNSNKIGLYYYDYFICFGFDLIYCICSNQCMSMPISFGINVVTMI